MTSSPAPWRWQRPSQLTSKRPRHARSAAHRDLGGGLAGLNAAYQLQQQSLRATVYEARGRLGGRVRSLTGPVGAGLTVELGGELINSNHEDMLALAADFDLKLFNRVEDAARFPFPAAGRSSLTGAA